MTLMEQKWLECSSLKTILIVLQKGNPIGERLAKVAANSGMLLMACDQCAYEREIDAMLVDGATIGCFPNLYGALSGNMPDQIITL